MTRFQKILCPLDLSENSYAAIELATLLADKYDARLVLIYVAPQWLPEEAMFHDDYTRAAVVKDKKRFQEIRPNSDNVEYEHLFLNGNPGPEIVRASKNCDLVVMSTHGQSGFMRLLMGSVSRYVLQHAACPVILFKNPAKNLPVENRELQPQHFVTERMQHACPIYRFDEMDKVMADLKRAKQTGAPVVNDMGICIGILTKSDIDKYRELQERYKQRDETVVDEMFEVDEFGQRRAGNSDFNQVHRHMTSPVVTVANTESCEKARELFDLNQEIHHLLVVDDAQHPIGILEVEDLAKCKTEVS